MWINKRNNRESKANLMALDYATKQIVLTNSLINKIKTSVIEGYQQINKGIMTWYLTRNKEELVTLKTSLINKKQEYLFYTR
jgi:hypothetical protein